MRMCIAEKIMLSLLLLIGIAIIFIIAMGIYQTAVSEKLTLIKDQWVCTDTRTVTQGVLVGKVIVNQPVITCSNYSMK